MSKRKANGHFGDGNKFGSLGGRPAMPQDIKEARKVNREHLEKTLNMLLQMGLTDLQEFMKDFTRPTIELMAANIILQATTKADHFRMGFILDRLGLVVKKAEETEKTEDNVHAQLVSTLNQIESKNGR